MKQTRGANPSPLREVHPLPDLIEVGQNLKHQVAQYVRDSILSGVMRPGERLNQDEIARTFGISRLPVREALIALESEGLIENKPRRGAFVAPLERQDIQDHFEIYGVLSGLAARRAAHALTPEALERLKEIVEAQRTATDPSEHDRLNFLFHQAISRAGASGRLRAVLLTLSNNMPSRFYEFNIEWPWKDQALDEHDEIVRALVEKDAGGAAIAVTQHFRTTGEQAVRMLESVQFWDE